MKKISYSPAANHHPGWLKFLFLLIFFGTTLLVNSFTHDYFQNSTAYIGIPIGLVSGYYIAYFGLYGFYVKFSDVSKDDLFEQLEKKETEKKQMEEVKRLQEMSNKIREKDENKKK